MTTAPSTGVGTAATDGGYGPVLALFGLAGAAGIAARRSHAR